MANDHANTAITIEERRGRGLRDDFDIGLGFHRALAQPLDVPTLWVKPNDPTRVSASVDDSIGFSLCDACSPITLKSFSVRAAPFATWKGDTLYRDLAAQAKKWNSPSATDESGTKLNEYLSSHCRFSCSGRSRPRVEERADFRFP